VEGVTSGSMINSEPINTGGLPLLSRYFTGELYSSAMWDIELTQEQVTDDFNGLAIGRSTRNSPANLIMWNKMGEDAIIGANIFYPDFSGASSGYNSVNMDASNIMPIL
jgi:hypothetical protein